MTQGADIRPHAVSAALASKRIKHVPILLSLNECCGTPDPAARIHTTQSRYTPCILIARRTTMIYFKGALVGFGSVLLGMPIALIVWSFWRSQSASTAVSFSPLGLANHLPELWLLIVVLFIAGFASFVLAKRR